MDSNTQHYFRNVFVPLEGRAGWAHKSLPLSIDVLLKVGDGNGQEIEDSCVSRGARRA